MLRILLDLGHPVDYYFFRNVIKKLRERGDEILIVVRNREGVVTELLQNDGERYILLGENVRGMLNKAVYMVRNDVKLLKIALEFKPDMFLSLGSIYSGHVSFLIGKPHLTFHDTEISWIVQLLLMPPFTKIVMIPDSVQLRFSFRNYIRVNAGKELAYLSPAYFQLDPIVLNEFGLKPGEKYVILRFSAHDSSHDIGLKGLSNESKRRLVSELMKFAKVFISSEVGLDEELSRHRIRIKRMHDFLGFSSLFIGEGPTMVSEAAFLGVPSIFLHKRTFGCIENRKMHGMVFQYDNPDDEIEQIINHAKQILTDPGAKERFLKLRDEMVATKEDIVLRIIHEIDSLRL